VNRNNLKLEGLLGPSCYTRATGNYGPGRRCRLNKEVKNCRGGANGIGGAKCDGESSRRHRNADDRGARGIEGQARREIGCVEGIGLKRFKLIHKFLSRDCNGGERAGDYWRRLDPTTDGAVNRVADVNSARAISGDAVRRSEARDTARTIGAAPYACQTGESGNNPGRSDLADRVVERVRDIDVPT